MPTENLQNDIMSFIRTAVGVAPVAFAAYQGAITIKSNSPINTPIAQSNPINELGKKIGATAKDLSSNRKAIKASQAEALRKALRTKLESSDFLQEIFQNAEKRNGLIQALTLTLDDPSLAVEDSARIRLKQQLVELSHTNLPDQEKIIGDVLKTVSETSSDDVVSRFNQLRNQFTEIGSQLGVAKQQIPKSGVAFSSVPHANLSTQEKDYIGNIQKALGNDFKVEAVGYNEFGREFRQARIYRSTMMGDKYQASIPMSNDFFYRSGESGRTLYRMPIRMMDLQKTAAMLDRGSNISAIAKAAIMPHDFFAQELIKRAGQGPVEFTDYRAWMRSFMTNVDRIAASEENFGLHTRIQAQHKMNVVGLFNLQNLSPQQQSGTIAKLGALGGIFDPGVGHKRLLGRGSMGITGVMGIRRNSMMSRLQKLYGWNSQSGNVVDRTIVPLTLREHQLVGRTAAFVGDSVPIGKTGLVSGSILSAVSGNLDQASFSKALEAVSPFGDLVSGGLGTPVLLDVSKSGRLTVGAGGSGMAFTSKAREVATPIKFSILDPKTHGYLGSDILNRLRSAGDKGLFLSAEELRKGIYLGETGLGSKILPWDELTTGMHLKLSEVTEEAVGTGTKRTISVAGSIQKKMSMFKTFGLLHKGNVEVIDDVMSLFDDEQSKLFRSVMRNVGLDEKGVIAASSDMLSKGAIGFMHQLGGGARLVSNGGITLQELSDRASQVASRASQVLDIHREAGAVLDVDYRPLAHYAEGAMELMHAKGINASHIGLVMAGVYHGAEGASSKYGLDKTSIMTLAQNLFGKDSKKFKAFNDAINLGVTIGYDVMGAGEMVNDWGRARAGVEPRFAKTLHERLLGFGLNIESASNVVAGLYRNKIGLGPHFELAAQLLDMTSFTSGTSTAANFVSNRSKRRMTYNELMSAIVADNDHSLTEILKRTPGGLVLDLTQAPASVAHAAKDVFGQGELFLPGKEAFDAALGTTIKQAEGASLSVDSQLGKLVNSLQERLVSFTKDTRRVRESLGGWKEQADQLFVGVFDQLHSGKIKGGVSPTAGLYDLTQGTNFGTSTKMLKRARDVFFHSKGQAVFQTAEGFVSQLSEMSGTVSKKDLSWKARQFFTAMEQSRKKWTGLMGIGGRHPMMSTGNVFMTQTFRHLKEIERLGGEDLFFSKIKSSPVGQQIIEKSFTRLGQISSFAAIARQPLPQQKKFFDSLVSNISEFTSGRSGSALFYPTLKTNQGDIGIGAQAFLDMDGDHGVHFFFDRPTGKHIAAQMRGRGDQLVLQDFKIRAFMNSMVGQTKGALGSLKDRMMSQATGMSLEEKVWQDVMKEIGTSVNTGGLDVSLRPLHEAFLMYESDPMQKAFGRMFLGSMQESFVIKGKKLPIATDYPQQIRQAAKHLTATGDVGQLRTLLYDIFGEQDIAKGGMLIQGDIKVDPNADSTLRAQFDRMFKTAGGEARFTERYHLEDFLSRAETVMRQSIAQGTHTGLSQGQLSSMLADDPVRALASFQSAPSMNAGAMEGFFGKNLSAKTGFAADQLISGLSKLDASMTGKLAVGVAASAMLLSMMRGGTAPEPLLMPEESISQGILNEVSAGNLFSRKDPDVSLESIGPVANNYDSMPPINTGSTYINRGNSYQIRGEVSSGNGLNSYSSYFNQLTSGQGHGTVTINDQRRPITSNYVDRLLGV